MKPRFWSVKSLFLLLVVLCALCFYIHAERPMRTACERLRQGCKTYRLLTKEFGTKDHLDGMYGHAAEIVYVPNARWIPFLQRPSGLTGDIVVAAHVPDSSPDAVEALAQFQALGTVSIRGTEINSRAADILKSLPHLWDLTLRNCQIAPEDLRQVLSSSTLFNVALIGTPVTDKSLGPLQLNNRLHSLYIDSLPGSNTFFENASSWPRLTRLTAGGRSGDVFFVRSEVIPCLRAIQLLDYRFTAAAARQLAQMEHLWNVDVSGCTVDYDALTELAMSNSIKAVRFPIARLNRVDIETIASCFPASNVTEDPFGVVTISVSRDR